MKTIHRLLIPAFALFLTGTLSAQEPAKQEQTEAGAKQEDEFTRKGPETKITEVVTTDSLPASELLKRAVNFIKVEHQHYKKSGGSTSGSKAEFLASFAVKPKELNPEVDYTGKITMKVVIECKAAKYRYTVSDIRHLSKSGRATAGSVDNIVPECGSMTMNALVWKKLKGEAMRDAQVVVNDLKAGMSTNAPASANADDW
jgi:hypothetical protein